MKLLLAFLVPLSLAAQDQPKSAGSVDLGYRWNSNVAGSLDTYRSIVNLGEGPRVLGFEYSLLEAPKKAWDRLDMQTGKKESFIRGEGGSVRPQVSPDGKTIAFVRRVRLKTVLYLYDVESGIETPMYDNLNRDAQETWAIFGVHPGFSWTPDGSSIVISATG